MDIPRAHPYNTTSQGRKLPSGEATDMESCGPKMYVLSGGVVWRGNHILVGRGDTKTSVATIETQVNTTHRGGSSPHKRRAFIKNHLPRPGTQGKKGGGERKGKQVEDKIIPLRG